MLHQLPTAIFLLTKGNKRYDNERVLLLLLIQQHQKIILKNFQIWFSFVENNFYISITIVVLPSIHLLHRRREGLPLLLELLQQCFARSDTPVAAKTDEKNVGA